MIHHNCVRVLDYFFDAKFSYMVMELEQGGNLKDYLLDRFNLVVESRCKVIAQKLAQGIEYLHSMGILIGRLNIKTIMMTDKSDQAVPRISNLSQAQIATPFMKSNEPLNLPG